MRNALAGYTYQHHVTLLILSLMDVEREILKIEIESITPDNFDDIIIDLGSKRLQLQIKDFENVSVKDLKIDGDQIHIKGKNHKLSKNHNIIFFKDIDIKPDTQFLKFPCQRISENVSLVSLARTQIDEEIEILYENNPHRKNEINSFFNSKLDKRIWDIPIDSLPQLKIFLTELQEESVLITHQLLEFENILLIEGKPGVGKSHFVNTLIDENNEHILYRFWIGNQDNDYNQRLKFKNFLRDLNTKLFNDQKSRTKQNLFSKLKKDKKVFIIDGLDHVENYNKKDLEEFVNFINEAKTYCKIIVLSRPLANQPNWKKQVLENWSLDQTKRVLDELYFITDYQTISKIYHISQGYPIIVKYLAEHYKINNTVPNIDQVDDINSYYHNTIKDQKSLFNLSLFLCCNSFVMKSEIEMFIGIQKNYVEPFINEYPYLFDIKLNRISLFHDSFNTFLRTKVDYKVQVENVNNIVTANILNLDKRFLSRVSYFQLSQEQKKKIIKRYASIEILDEILKNTIDFEAIRDFYNQLRELLCQFPSTILNINEYYDLSLIFNIVMREHINTINTFYYTYVNCLIENGVTDDEITSSHFLFGMYYYCKTKNAVLLLNRTAKDHYDTEDFYFKLEMDISTEEMHIEKHGKILDADIITRALKDKMNFRENLTHILENIGYHQSEIKGYKYLKNIIDEYIYGNKVNAIFSLEQFLLKHNERDYYAEWLLRDVYENLLSFGCTFNDKDNEYKDLTLQKLIENHRELGSFNLRDKIHNYIRLSVLQGRKIDIQNIYSFWTKYYQRKDSTFLGITIALNTLEKEGIVKLAECIKFIHNIQEISEKGYRNILSEFIKFYSPNIIIPFLEQNFDFQNFRLEWFKLPPKYINHLSERVFNHQKHKLIRYHRNYGIPFDEIENVLHSNKSSSMVDYLRQTGTKIRFNAEKQKIVEKLKNTNLKFEKQNEVSDTKKYRKSSQQRFDRNILTLKDLPFIIKNKLRPEDIAKCSDSYYHSLPHLEIFKVFDTDELKKNLRKIIYNSLTGKEKGSSYYFYLSYHQGNMLKMIKEHRNEKEFKRATSSLVKFINMSMFKIELN